MANERMGDYEVLSDTRTAEASLRLLRISPGMEVRPHYHKKSTQVYVVLSGRAAIRLGEGRLQTRPFDKVEIPPLTVHGLTAPEPALVLSISVPPMAPDDQHPVDVARPRLERVGEPSYGGE